MRDYRDYEEYDSDNSSSNNSNGYYNSYYNEDDHLEENQRMSKRLHERDYNDRYNQYLGSREERRHPHDYSWDEGNYFHTGPASHGAQDRDRAGEHHQQHHYGTDPRSAYRNPNALNYGSSHSYHHEHYGTNPHSAYRDPNALNYGNTRSYRYGGWSSGSAPGDYNELPAPGQDPHWETPGSRSRYKETDYRYGSGHHNWFSNRDVDRDYWENRYAHMNPIERRNREAGWGYSGDAASRNTYNTRTENPKRGELS